jgi:hypothetical protein
MFACLFEIAEAFNLDKKGTSSIYDGQNSLWVVKEIMKIVNNYVKTNQQANVLLLNLSSDSKYVELNALIGEKDNVLG